MKPSFTIDENKVLARSILNTHRLLATLLASAVLLSACLSEASAEYTVSTLTDSAGEQISFSRPEGLAFDGDGNLYVLELITGTMRRVSPEGRVQTLLAAGTLSLPEKLVVDDLGAIYITESAAHQVVRLADNGTLRVIAGTGDYGFAEGDAAQAQFFLPLGIAVDAAGNIYVADTGNDRIRTITPEGQVGTLAGGQRGFAEGQGEQAKFDGLAGLALDRTGNLYVADVRNARVRLVTLEGLVTTLAGSGARGFADGPALVASFKGPVDVAVDTAGNVYVADLDNHSIRLITLEGQVTTIAGNGDPGYADGSGTEARFNFPVAVAVDPNGVIYVADAGNGVVRVIRSSFSR